MLELVAIVCWLDSTWEKKRLKTYKGIIVTSPRKKSPPEKQLFILGDLTRLWQAKNRRQNTPEKVNLLSPAEGENQHPISKLDLVDQWLQILAFLKLFYSMSMILCLLTRFLQILRCSEIGMGNYSIIVTIVAGNNRIVTICLVFNSRKSQLSLTNTMNSQPL